MEAVLVKILEKLDSFSSNFNPGIITYPNIVTQEGEEVDMNYVAASDVRQGVNEEQVDSLDLVVRPGNCGMHVEDVAMTRYEEEDSSEERGDYEERGPEENVEENSTEEKSDFDFVVNGVDVSEIPSRNPYSYALRLMDVFFTKQEMAVSLLFKSRKSDKPALAEDRVKKLLSYVEMRFGDEWDLKTLTAKANQKCRDSRDSLIL